MSGLAPSVVAWDISRLDGWGYLLNSVQTSMSLRFLGSQNATRGGLEMAPLNHSEICKIGRCLYSILAVLWRLGCVVGY